MRNNYEYDFEFDWNIQANAIAKKSPTMILLDRQHQLAQKQGTAKALIGKPDDKGFELKLLCINIGRRRTKFTRQGT